MTQTSPMACTVMAKKSQPAKVQTMALRDGAGSAAISPWVSWALEMAMRSQGPALRPACLATPSDPPPHKILQILEGIRCRAEQKHRSNALGGGQQLAALSEARRRIHHAPHLRHQQPCCKSTVSALLLLCRHAVYFDLLQLLCCCQRSTGQGGRRIF